MIPIILEEGLAIVRTAYNIWSAKQAGETLVDALTSEEARGVSREELSEDEETYFYLLAMALHDHLRNTNSYLPAEPAAFIDVTEKVIYNSPLFERSNSDALNRVSSWMAIFAKVVAVEYPEYEEAFLSLAEDNLQSGTFQTDFVRQYLKSGHNLEKYVETMKEMGFDRDKVSDGVKALMEDANWDEPSDTLSYAPQTLISLVTAEFRAKRVLDDKSVGAVTMTTTYLPHMSGAPAQAERMMMGRYQKYTVTREDMNAVERMIQQTRESISKRMQDSYEDPSVQKDSDVVKTAADMVVAAGVYHAKAAAVRKLKRLRKAFGPKSSKGDKTFMEAVKMIIKTAKK